MSSLTPSDNNMDMPPAIPEELRWKYSQTKCNRVRACKEAGGKHNLCSYHRDRANAAQKRFAKRSGVEPRRNFLLRLSELNPLDEGFPFEIPDPTSLGGIVDGVVWRFENEEDYEWLWEALLQLDN